MKLDLKYNGNNLDKIANEYKKMKNEIKYIKLIEEANNRIIEDHHKEKEVYLNAKNYIAKSRVLKKNN